MTIDTVTAQLQGAGLPAAAAGRVSQLIDDAGSALLRVCGHPPRWAWFVPGRVEVFGKHTDYAGGRSLVGAVPRGFGVVAAPRADGRVRVIDARWHETAMLDPSDETTPVSGWRRYIMVVARRLAADFPGAELGLDLVLSSDLPRAAGVSSSSALVVGVASACIRRAGLDTRADWRVAVGEPIELAGYLGAVENGLPFKSLPGTSGVGTFGGSEDHTAILTCRPDRLSAYAYVPVRPIGDAVMPPDWTFVIAASGIQADKAGAVRERYNRASLGTRALVSAWRQATGQSFLTLAELLSASAGAAEELAGIVTRPGEVDGFDADALTQRLAHFIAEDGRVPLALDAFRRADAATLGDLSAASQDDADRLLGNQIAETRALVELARREGAWAASSFGAGFGGSVWALAPAADAPAFARQWIDAYARAAPHIGQAEWFIARPGPGMVEINGI